MADAARAYLDLSADDRFEARVPKRLEHDAEAVAQALGYSLSEYVLRLLADRVADDLPATQQWRLTPTEQAQLLRILGAPSEPNAALEAARKRAEEVFGHTP